MDTVEVFLAHSIRLEQEAARRFEQLADAMSTHGNRDVGQLFSRLARFSRMHLADATARAGFRDMPEAGTVAYQWPDVESPETAAIWAADPLIGREQALQVALEAESAGLAFYREVLRTTADAEIRHFAQIFADEEAQHVAELERWLAQPRDGAA